MCQFLRSWIQRKGHDCRKGNFLSQTIGGMGVEADRFAKRLAEKISMKRDKPYSKIIAFMRKRLMFDLAKTTLIALRGYQAIPNPDSEKIKDLVIHLEKTAV